MKKAIEHAKPHVQSWHRQLQHSFYSRQKIPFQRVFRILDNWVDVLQKEKKNLLIECNVLEEIM